MVVPVANISSSAQVQEILTRAACGAICQVGRRQNEFFFGRAKRVDVFESAAPNKPVIYLNTYGCEGGADLSVFDRHRLSGFFAWLQSVSWNGIVIWCHGIFRPYSKWCIIYQRSR